MSLYTKRLTREQAQAQFEAAIGKMPLSFAALARDQVSFDKPLTGAMWLHQHAYAYPCPDAASAAFFAVLGYHNTLVAESIAAEERAAHEAEEEARAADDDGSRKWASRERPPERIDDVTADEIGEQQ